LDTQKFERDLAFLASRACKGGIGSETDELARMQRSLEEIRGRLLDLYRRNLVKINHSAMELLCAKKLIEAGYELVNVEHPLKDNLICDIFGKSSAEGKSAIVEIETGFVSPEYALQPLTYARARIASKIARYSAFSEKFILGTTPTNVLRIPRAFLVPQHLRTAQDIKEIKGLCDLYYRNPEVSHEEIMKAKIDSIFVIDVDRVRIDEIDADSYADKAKDFNLIVEN
jgi:hypothetical protein